MKSVRVVLAVVALLALPFGAVAAQGRSSKPKPRTANLEASECKDQQASTLGRQNDVGHNPYGLDKKCDVSGGGGGDNGGGGPPPADTPPTGMHFAAGLVYEDVDGDGSQNVYAGELGLAGWTVQLYWNSQLVTSSTTDAEGKYLFSNIGAGDLWAVCVVAQAGYNRTQPASGNACGGDGVLFVMPNNSFPTQQWNIFAWMLQ